MTIQKLPGSAITPGTITVTQLESSVATTVQTGGGPKLTNIQVTDNTYTVLDDTAVDVTGGYIKITGTGFVTGCSVIVGQLPAASVTFISSTEVRAQLSAQSAGTYIVYLVNPDGGVGIRVNGVTHSASPAWQTASGLPEQYDGVAINLSLVATDATSYTITSGSLPPGLSLNSNTGVISGTVSGVANDTLYTFTVRATDAQLQDSPRTFTVTITVSDPYFKLTTLLLSGSAVSANTVVRDSSTNNFNLTVSGDARASNFTPYGTGWSVYFDGTGDYLSTTSNAAFALGSGNFTFDMWVYSGANGTGTRLAGNGAGGPWTTNRWVMTTSVPANPNKFVFATNNYGGDMLVSTSTFNNNQWMHVAVVRSGNAWALWVNGTREAYIANNATAVDSGSSEVFNLGRSNLSGDSDWAGYVSGFRMVKGTAVYDPTQTTITVPTAPLTAISGTSLLTCQSNRFIDSSTNNFTITRNGDTAIRSFNPFNITNTGVNGSMYFDGSGDNVLVPTSANSIITGNSNFTLELWVFVTGAPGTYHGLFGGGSNDFTFSYSSQNSWGLYIAKVGLPPFIYTGMTVYNNLFQRWSHLAVTKNGTTWTIWVNGNSAVSVTDAVTFTNTQKAMGSQLGSDYMQGYISNVRYTAEVVYTNAFTPPAAPLTAIANTQLLTLQYDQPHNNHTFLDSSSNQFLITRSGNATQGTFSPFSQTGWSNYFGSVSDYLSFSSIALGSSFTLEFFVFFTTSVSSQHICLSNMSGGGGTNWIGINATTITLSYGGTDRTFSFAPSGGVWYYIQIINSSSSLNCYVNGSQVGTTQTGPSSFSIDRIGGYPSNGLAGYLSSLRVVNSARSVSTTPTSPLTAVTGTQLLTCQSNRFRDASTNNFTVTPTGSPSVQAFSPFAPTAVYDPAVHGGSVYFDISGDYLSTPSTTQLDFGTDDFTIEFYFYAIAANYAASEGVWPFFSAEGYFGGGGSVNWDLLYYDQNSTFSLNRRISDVDSGIGSNAVTLPKQSWNHLAVVRSSGTVKFYLNGTDIGGGSYTNNINSTSVLNVNRRRGGNGTVIWYANMYMSSIRIVKSTAVYTSAFTPPTAPVTATTNTQLLLNFTDTAIVDSTGRTVLETAGDAKSSSVITKFTGGSMLFDGNGDNLAAPTTPNLNMGTGDWTIECWVYILSRTLNYPLIFGNNNGSYTAGALALTNSNADSASYNDRFFLAAYDVATPTLVASSVNSLNTWYHLALVRNGTNLVMYRDGISVASRTITSSITFDWGKGGVRVGGGNWDAAQSYFNGYIQDLKVTRGYARYTGNFTAPTAPARLK